MASFESQAANFWFVDEHSRKVPGATRTELDAAEEAIGFRLPVELRALLVLQDGGIPRLMTFGEILFSPMRGVANKHQCDNIPVMHGRAANVEALPLAVVIFAADASAWFGLDYRTTQDSPTILFWSEEQDHPRTIAPSFRAFVEGLTE
jgi:hypothetical protein